MNWMGPVGLPVGEPVAGSSVNSNNGFGSSGGSVSADHRNIHAMHYAFLFFAPPWRALKRGFDLQTT